MKCTFKQFLAEETKNKYSYETIQDFIEFFDDDFTPSKPGSRLVIVAKKGTRKNSIFENKSAEQIAKICQQYFNKTVRVENWTKKGDKETKIFFDWDYSTPAEAKVLYTQAESVALGRTANKDESQRVYKELNDMDRALGKIGGAVGYCLNGYSDHHDLIGVFTDGPANGTPFVAKHSWSGRELKKGDKFYATVDTERGNCVFKGTTRTL